MNSPGKDQKGNALLEALLFGITLVLSPIRKRQERRVPPEKLEELFPEESLPELPPPPKLRHTEFHIRSGWSQPKPESLAAPTYAPAGMAMGVVFIAFGLISKWYIVGVGLAIAILAMWRWIGELTDD